MRDRNVPVEKAWNTWKAEYPAQFVHLPSGFHLAVCAYSDREQAFTRFPAGDQVRLGPRSIDGSFGELELEHGGTALKLTFEKPDPFHLRARWQTIRTGEWGLRFWVLLCAFFAPDPREPRRPVLTWDSAARRLVGVRDELEIVLAGDVPPFLVTFHDGFAQLEEEFRQHGYFYKGSMGTGGSLAVLRYNLEEMPSMTFSARVQLPAADPITGAIVPAMARPPREAELESPVDPAEPAHRKLDSGRAEEGPERWMIGQEKASEPPSDVEAALDAVRDIIAWNTVWDEVHHRPYTTASRNWVAQKFGGWGIWLNDQLYHALLASPFDPHLARDNLRAALSGTTPEGNLPCLMTGRDAWVDRSQPPIASFIVWMIYLRTGERSILEAYYPTLARSHRWWRRTRAGNGNGLFAYGSSPVGTGLYRGTKLAAKDESHMDNSPVHDEAVFVAEKGTLDCEDVGLNSLLALDGEMLARMARVLGRDEEAAGFQRDADALKERIAHELWDEGRGLFANRLWSGRFVRSVAPTSFYPLLAGAATEEQARLLVERLLLDEDAFWGDFPLPSVAKWDPAFADNVYWRGRVWPPLNFLVYYGLRRCGFTAEATALAAKSFALFRREWEERRHAHENWNAVTGAGCDQGDSDTFYGWSALMPWLAAAEWMDWTPWEGWSVTHGNPDPAASSPDAWAPRSIGPVWTGQGWCSTVAKGGWFSIRLNGQTVLRTNIVGRFRHVQIRREFIGLDAPPGLVTGDGAPPVIELPGVSPLRVAAAVWNGRPLTPESAASADRPAAVLRLPTEGAPHSPEPRGAGLHARRNTLHVFIHPS